MSKIIIEDYCVGIISAENNKIDGTAFTIQLTCKTNQS